MNIAQTLGHPIKETVLTQAASLVSHTAMPFTACILRSCMATSGIHATHSNLAYTSRITYQSMHTSG